MGSDPALGSSPGGAAARPRTAGWAEGPWWHGLGGRGRALLCGLEEVIILEHLARDPQLLQLHMLTQLTQVIHIEDLLPKLEADDGLKEDEQGLDEHGGVHDVQGLNILLVLAVKLAVGVPEPAEGGLLSLVRPWCR